MILKRRENFSIKSFLESTVSAQIHFFGFFLSFFSLLYLLRYVVPTQSDLHFVAAVLYGYTAMLVFGTSSVYHFLSDGFHLHNKVELLFEDLDHFAIYFFIAGTYTPFVLNVIAPPWQGRILTLVWLVAFLGVIYTAVKKRLPFWAQSRILYTGIFVLLGWTALIRAEEVYRNISPVAFRFLLIGGLCYSLGALVYAFKWPRLWPKRFGFHELWHVAVLLGFYFHYLMVLSFYKTI